MHDSASKNHNFIGLAIIALSGIIAFLTPIGYQMILSTKILSEQFDTDLWFSKFNNFYRQEVVIIVVLMMVYFILEAFVIKSTSSIWKYCMLIMNMVVYGVFAYLFGSLLGLVEGNAYFYFVLMLPQLLCVIAISAFPPYKLRYRFFISKLIRG